MKIYRYEDGRYSSKQKKLKSWDEEAVSSIEGGVNVKVKHGVRINYGREWWRIDIRDLNGSR